MKPSLNDQISTAVDQQDREALKRILGHLFKTQLRRRTVKAVSATLVVAAALLALTWSLSLKRAVPRQLVVADMVRPELDSDKVEKLREQLTRMEHQLQSLATRRSEIPGESSKPANGAKLKAAEPATGEHETITVQFASDRTRSQNAQNETVLTSDIATELWYGSCDVSIPATHKLGELERPAWWRLEFRENPDRHVVLMGMDEISREEFVDGLRSDLLAADQNAALIFIHGYNVSFDDAARRTAQLAYDLEFKGVPLFFDWASAGNAPAYPHDLVSARASVPHLIQFLADALDAAGTKNAYIIAHSMGNEVLAEALRGFFETHPQCRTQVQEIVLAAPDIDARIFREQIAPRLAGYAIPVTMYVSATDKALQVSRSVWGQPRAGDAKGGVLVLSGVETIDATDVDTSFLGHSYVAEERTLLTDLSQLLSKRQRAAARFGLREIDVPEGHYWQFKR